MTSWRARPGCRWRSRTRARRSRPPTPGSPAPRNGRGSAPGLSSVRCIRAAAAGRRARRSAETRSAAPAQLARALGRDHRDPDRQLEAVEPSERLEVGRVVARRTARAGARVRPAARGPRCPCSRRPAGGSPAPFAPSARAAPARAPAARPACSDATAAASSSARPVVEGGRVLLSLRLPAAVGDEQVELVRPIPRPAGRSPSRARRRRRARPRRRPAGVLLRSSADAGDEPVAALRGRAGSRASPRARRRPPARSTIGASVPSTSSSTPAVSGRAARSATGFAVSTICGE